MDANELIPLLWHCTWVSSLATLVVLACRVPLRRLAGAELAYLAWALVPTVVLVSLLPRSMPVRHVVLDTAAADGPVAATLPFAAVQASAWPWLLLAVWAGGVCVALAVACMQQRRFRTGMRDAVAVGTGEGGIAIYRARGDVGPALVGAWRAAIVLPADFDTRYTAGERMLILAHEHAHAARGDGFANAVCAAMLALAWFNPLAHAAVRIFRRDQEMACDAAVLRHCGQPKTYANAMLKTELSQRPLPAGCAWLSTHPLKERIAMLNRSLPGRRRRWFGSGAVVAGTLLAAGVTYGGNPARHVAPQGSIGLELKVTSPGAPLSHSLLCIAPGQKVDVVGHGAPGEAPQASFRITPDTTPGQWRLTDFSQKWTVTEAKTHEFHVRGGKKDLASMTARTNEPVEISFGEAGAANSMRLSFTPLAKCVAPPEPPAPPALPPGPPPPPPPPPAPRTDAVVKVVVMPAATPAALSTTTR
jgi:beta-lactamase regulating signal transducer with metallopeptidase domain